MTQNIQVPSFLESIANELLSRYRRLDSILSHAPSKGSYHEKILRDVIRGYLPSTFSVGEGFIINKQGVTSSQLDVLIVDNFDPRSFGYKDNDFFIATDISVTCFGEIKTYCHRNEFVKSFHNLINSSMLVDDNHSARITSFLFCYDAYASAKAFSKWTDIAISKLPNRSLVKTWNYPDYVFCLKKKIMLEKRHIEGGVQYWDITPVNPKSNLIEEKIIQDLFQCVVNGCGRIRMQQGIILLEK
jgi:hypothetical protein